MVISLFCHLRQIIKCSLWKTEELTFTIILVLSCIFNKVLLLLLHVYTYSFEVSETWNNREVNPIPSRVSKVVLEGHGKVSWLKWKSYKVSPHLFLSSPVPVLTCSCPHLFLSSCVSALGVCPQQCSLPAESVAASGSIGPICQSHRASSAGDLHSRGHQGLHHIAARVGPRHPQVRSARVSICSVRLPALYHGTSSRYSVKIKTFLCQCADFYSVGYIW